MSLGIESLRNSRINFLYFVYIHLISVYVTCIFYNMYISTVCVCVCVCVRAHAQRVKRGKKQVKGNYIRIEFLRSQQRSLKNLVLFNEGICLVNLPTHITQVFCLPNDFKIISRGDAEVGRAGLIPSWAGQRRLYYLFNKWGNWSFEVCSRSQR